MDPILPTLVASAFGILLIGAGARAIGQPYVIAYLIAGILLGPSGTGVFSDLPSLTRLGEFGVILLLFFVGMEVDLKRLAIGWRVSVIGTALQILVTVACVAGIGLYLGWALERILLFGFAMSLSSTALVVSMLREWRELDSEAGGDALGILLVQDVAVIGMLITIGVLSGGAPSAGQITLQAIGTVAFCGLLAYLVRGGTVHLPFRNHLRDDHEMQVFFGFLLCFGCSYVSAFLGLSTALGAFAAGLIVAAARETDWIHRSLEPFRVIFVAFFFVSIGMLMDLDFLREHWAVLGLLVFVAMVTNTVINAGILRVLGRGWGTSLYVGALLSQVGEFSFVLAAVGKQSGIITEFAYQGIICVIAGTLLITPLWIAITRPRRGPSARLKVEEPASLPIPEHGS